MKSNDRQSWLVIGLLLAMSVILLYAFAILYGGLNQDEGWYLYAGRMVHEGNHPFLDFASTQGPLMAYLYSLAWPMVATMGVLGGRLFTAALGIGSLMVTGWLAIQMTVATNEADDGPDCGIVAGLLAVGLLGLNLYHVYFTSLVKTYSTAGLLALVGLWCLVVALSQRPVNPQGKRSFFLGFLGAGLFALAAGTRLSAGVLLPATWLPLAFCWWRSEKVERSRLMPVLIGMLLGGAVSLIIVYGPFLLFAPDALSFGLLDYHAAREVGRPVTLMIYKAGFILRLCAFYFPLLVIASISLVAVVISPLRVGSLKTPIPLVLGCGLIAVTLVHLAAPFPYDDYQVFIIPFAVLLVVPVAARKLGRFPLQIRGQRWIVLGALALMLTHSLSSPLVQDWLVDGRDRIWWPLKTNTDLQGLRKAAAEVRALAENSGQQSLLTQDTYLAVEAGLYVPDGMELGPFCYFPGLDDAAAERLHVLNQRRYLDLIANGGVQVAAFSDWGMAIRAPEIVPLENEAVVLRQVLAKHYAPVVSLERVGQGGTPLQIMKRKEQP